MISVRDINIAATKPITDNENKTAVERDLTLLPKVSSYKKLPSDHLGEIPEALSKPSETLQSETPAGDIIFRHLSSGGQDDQKLRIEMSRNSSAMLQHRLS